MRLRIHTCNLSPPGAAVPPEDTRDVLSITVDNRVVVLAVLRSTVTAEQPRRDVDPMLLAINVSDLADSTSADRKSPSVQPMARHAATTAPTIRMESNGPLEGCECGTCHQPGPRGFLACAE